MFQRDKVYIPPEIAAPSEPTTPQPTLSRPESNGGTGSQKRVRIQSKDGATDLMEGGDAHPTNGVGQSAAVEEHISSSKATDGLQSAAPTRNNTSPNGDVAAGAQVVEKSVQKKRKRAACCPVS